MMWAAVNSDLMVFFQNLVVVLSSAIVIVYPGKEQAALSPENILPSPKRLMLFDNLFDLPREDEHEVDPAWFERQKQRPVQSNDPNLRDWLATEVDAL